MFCVGDELPDGKWVFGGDGLQQESITFVIGLLSNIKAIDTRSLLLIDAIEKANGVMLPVFPFLYCANNECRQGADEDSGLPSDAHLPRLKEATLSKIREFKESSLLRNADHVGAVLVAWRYCGADAEARQWLLQQLETSVGTLQALRSTASLAISGGETTFTAINVERLWELVGEEVLDNAVSQIQWNEVDARDRTLEELYEDGRSSFRGNQPVKIDSQGEA